MQFMVKSVNSGPNLQTNLYISATITLNLP